MQKISHFWAKMKKDPKYQLGRFWPEPFNYYKLLFAQTRCFSLKQQLVKVSWTQLIKKLCLLTAKRSLVPHTREATRNRVTINT